MALPDLRPPPGPCFLIGGHGVTPQSPFDDFGTRLGHGRKRRIYVGPCPRYVNVSLDLSEEQAAAYDTWFENDLAVGSVKFTAEVARLGAQSKYWAAEWVGPPQWEPRAAAEGTRWRLSGVLYIVGEGSDTPPLGGVLVTQYAFDLNASGRVSSGVKLLTQYAFDLTARDKLATQYAFDLDTPEGGYYEREDGSGNIQREDGSNLQRE